MIIAIHLSLPTGLTKNRTMQKNTRHPIHPDEASCQYPVEAKNCRRICVAPMMNWTDRHCRYFHRLLTRHTWLYTEMVTTEALLRGNAAQCLAFNEEEHPLALQLGGSDPGELARCAKLVAAAHYDEINLNCGCPSGRMQRGAFGARLMAQPERVADCVRAMCNAVSIPVSVKHRIGINDGTDYAFVRDFVGTVASAGCHIFIVHARNAILEEFGPKENSNVPPLRYDYVHRLKCDFPELEIILNGGIQTIEQIEEHLTHVDGIMLGRQAYYQPWLLAGMDGHFYQTSTPLPQRTEIEAAFIAYAEGELARGTDLSAMTRHILGLYQDMPGAYSWRRILSDQRKLATGDLRIFDEARDHRLSPAVFTERNALTNRHTAPRNQTD